MRNGQIAAGLREIADLLEMTGENVFRIRAYRRAAEAVEALAEPVGAALARDPKGVAGVGSGIADHIKELEDRGTTQLTADLHKQYPASVVALLNVPGVGPKLAARVYQELGVADLATLEAAAADGRLAGLSRVGAKTAANILRNIAAFKEQGDRMPLGAAWSLVSEVMSALNAAGGVKRLTVAGSARRYQDTVGDLDLVGVADEPLAVMDVLVKLPVVERILGQGSTKSSVILSGGRQLDLRLVEAADFGSLLQHFTGSKQHNIQLREYAVARGLKISEYGIEDVATGLTRRFETEEAFYAALDLQFIPVELRQGRDEIRLAAKHALPALIEPREMLGDLHMHTNWSDGTETIERMVGAARDRGYRYMAISDHSGGLGVAHGLTPERLRAQRAEIREIASRYPEITVLAASEVDIRADGAMDFPDEVLAQLDLVIGSIHSAMSQSGEEATARLIRAIENPHVDIIGHPSTRLVGGRAGMDFDRQAVFAAAARTGTAMEVNANPARLDLRDADVRLALEAGVKLTIDTDAHAVDQLDLMEFGVRTARRGGARRQDVWNAAPLGEVLAWLSR
ncbi:MAG TPA: DNA polymerase/3'-5' exonuclease PolX [Chloroflexota bacterium]|nr:DNA polymerase/3'-5' exonuclease PolX [Chloroflexota bacterium]